MSSTIFNKTLAYQRLLWKSLDFLTTETKLRVCLSVIFAPVIMSILGIRIEFFFQCWVILCLSSGLFVKGSHTPMVSILPVSKRFAVLQLILVTPLPLTILGPIVCECILFLVNLILYSGSDYALFLKNYFADVPLLGDLLMGRLFTYLCCMTFWFLLMAAAFMKDPKTRRVVRIGLWTVLFILLAIESGRMEKRWVSRFMLSDLLQFYSPIMLVSISVLCAAASGILAYRTGIRNYHETFDNDAASDSAISEDRIEAFARTQRRGKHRLNLLLLILIGLTICSFILIKKTVVSNNADSDFEKGTPFTYEVSETDCSGKPADYVESLVCDSHLHVSDFALIFPVSIDPGYPMM